MLWNIDFWKNASRLMLKIFEIKGSLIFFVWAFTVSKLLNCNLKIFYQESISNVFRQRFTKFHRIRVNSYWTTPKKLKWSKDKGFNFKINFTFKFKSSDVYYSKLINRMPWNLILGLKWLIKLIHWIKTGFSYWKFQSYCKINIKVVL